MRPRKPKGSDKPNCTINTLLKLFTQNTIESYKLKCTNNLTAIDNKSPILKSNIWP